MTMTGWITLMHMQCQHSRMSYTQLWIEEQADNTKASKRMQAVSDLFCISHILHDTHFITDATYVAKKHAYVPNKY